MADETARRTLSRVGIAAVSAAVVAGLALWVFGSGLPVADTPCTRLVTTEEVAAWRDVPAGRPAIEQGDGRCRAAWPDARRGDRRLLALSLEIRPGGADERFEALRALPGARIESWPPERTARLGRSIADVRVVRSSQHATAIVSLDSERWVELDIEDEQQGDVEHWVRQIAERSALARW